jgi:hypothetical protein
MKRKMKAYPSDLESVVQRMIPVRDWSVIFDDSDGDVPAQFASWIFAEGSFVK